MGRLLCLIDCQNIFYGVRDMYGPSARIDFAKLREEAMLGRKFTSTRFVAYMTTYRDDSSGLRRVLERLHYEVKLQRIRKCHGHLVNTDIDTWLVADGLSASLHKGDVAVIASGDADMIPLYRALKACGCRVEVLTVPGCLSPQVSREVHEVRFLGEGILLEAVEVPA